MSTAAVATDASVPKKGKKKLIVIIAVIAVLLAALGGGAVVVMKKRAHAAEESADGDADAAPAKTADARHDPKAVPTFVPLDTFTVNLADRDAERYAQVGITLEVEDAHIGEQVKAYMPAIRNNILLALADKTATQLMEREGKERLAEQVRRETARAMGYAVAPEAASGAEGAKPKKRGRAADDEMPVTAVHFSNFIIQ